MEGRKPAGTATCRGILAQQFKYGLIPTPTVNGNNNRKGLSARSSDGLSTVVRSLLPTPLARSYKGTTIKNVQEGNPKRMLDGEMQVNGMKLQPAFVEWMMGYPLGYTDIGSSD
jgi:DNA (cytosine-5)-methyltransferase 1